MDSLDRRILDCLQQDAGTTDQALAAREVKQCYQVTGECDFVLIVSVPDMDAYDRFCDDVSYADGNMRKFRTLLSRRRTKFDTSASLG